MWRMPNPTWLPDRNALLGRMGRDRIWQMDPHMARASYLELGPELFHLLVLVDSEDSLEKIIGESAGW